MITSMTGYGKATAEINNKKFTVEIKSLNSKQLDLNVRLSGMYREKEVALRNHITSKLERGKVDLLIYFEAAEEDKNHKINQPLVQRYYNELKEASNLLDASDVPSDFLSIIMRMPDVLKSERPELDEGEWTEILKLVNQAAVEFTSYRNDEGKSLGKDIAARIDLIGSLLKEIEQFEGDRVEKVRERLSNNLKEFEVKDKLDANRFEQEIIYYLEKYDITEEKVRLNSHLDYFKETMSGSKSQGKKLGFIAQEIGREINTIGSKANNASIQQLVVKMKDELEKIKEQVLNVL